MDTMVAVYNSQQHGAGHAPDARARGSSTPAVFTARSARSGGRGAAAAGATLRRHDQFPQQGLRRGVGPRHSEQASRGAFARAFAVLRCGRGQPTPARLRQLITVNLARCEIATLVGALSLSSGHSCADAWRIVTAERVCELALLQERGQARQYQPRGQPHQRLAACARPKLLVCARALTRRARRPGRTGALPRLPQPPTGSECVWAAPEGLIFVASRARRSVLINNPVCQTMQQLSYHHTYASASVCAVPC
jgi:hypothetical protein